MEWKRPSRRPQLPRQLSTRLQRRRSPRRLRYDSIPVFFVKETAWKTLKERVEAPASIPTGRAQQRKSKKLTSWILIFQWILKKYPTDQDIAEANSRLCAWHIPESMNEGVFAEKLQERARKCGKVYKNRMLLELFANGVSPDIQDNLREYMCDHPLKDIEEIASHAQSVSRRDL